jgi:macrolide transport system ATP-binding/permease protein
MTGFANMIYVQAAGQDRVETAIRHASDTLSPSPPHQARCGEGLRRPQSQPNTPRRRKAAAMALLLAAASISLLVGGIGIMNILLVSVTDRTREIGLRMAIGSRRLHVLLQFLAEAIFLSVSRGLAGIVFGIALSAGISPIFGWPTPFSRAAVDGVAATERHHHKSLSYEIGMSNGC